MAYASRGSNSGRAAAGAAVALLQAGVVAALVSGLAVVITPEEARPPLAGYQIPIPKPIPDPTLTPKADDRPVPDARGESSEAVPSSDSTTNVDTVPTGGAGTMTTGGGAAEATGSATEEAARPLLTPRAAVLRGRSGDLVTTADYPAADERARHEGTTRFRLTIGTDGRVQSCEIVASSGFASLDAAACRKVAQRARFEPATDGYGSKAIGSYTGSVRWTIPRD